MRGQWLPAAAAALVLCLLLPLAGVAAPPPPPRVGVVLFSATFRPAYLGLRDGLAGRGLVDGRQVTFDVEDLQADPGRLPALMQRLRQRGVAVIVTTTTPVARRLQALNREQALPLVFTMVASPLQSGLVDSLRRPGRHTTGISHIAFETLPRRLILFKTAFPGLRRVALFYDPEEPFLQGVIERYLDRVAAELGIELVKLPVHDRAAMQRESERLTRADIDGIFMLPDPRSVAMLDQLQALASRERLPLMVVDNSLLPRAGVMAYSPAFYEVGRQAAGLVAAILGGADAGSLPVQNPLHVRLVVSMKEARRLGLRPSDEILAQADRIIR